MIARKPALLTLFAALALPMVALAQELTFAIAAPATITATQTTPGSTLAVATGRWTAATGTPMRSVAGTVSQTAYRLEGADLSTHDLLAPLQDGLLADGFTLLFSCETQGCGGFDFRFDLPVLPEPDMHVDLGDFRYLAAIRGADSPRPQVVMIITSRSGNAGFVQISQVGDVVPDPRPTAPAAGDAEGPVAAAVGGPAGGNAVSAAQPTVAPVAPPPAASAQPAGAGDGDMAHRLETGGAFALDDLVFASGAADLAPGSYPSLAALAAYLAAHPHRQIAIVGHTDASGGLEANIALSRRRAQSVRRALVETPGVAAAQVQAEGVGYLSPRASNLTEAGRAANRRVEVMLTSTE